MIDPSRRAGKDCLHGGPVSPINAMHADICPNEVHEPEGGAKEHEGDGGASDGEECAEGGPGEEMRRPVRAQTPMDPTQAERDEHYLTGHATYRSWCDACVRARGRATQHRRSEGGTLPVISWDYCYLSHDKVGKEAESPDEEAERRGHSPVLVSFDSSSKAIGAAIHPSKGVRFDGIEDAVAFWVRYLNRLGYKRVIFRSDNEAALLSLIERIRTAWHGEVVPETSEVEDPQSNGAAEAAVGIIKGMVRTLKLRLEACIQTKVPDGHAVYAWMVNHAAGSYRRFRVGPDGKTPYERLTTRKWGAQMAEFGEYVWFTPSSSSESSGTSRMNSGYYLGPLDGKKGSCIMTENGVTQSRSIRRRATSEAWNAKILETVNCVPLIPPSHARAGPTVRGPVHHDPNAEGVAQDHDVEARRGQPRRAMLLYRDFERYGWTSGCDLCLRMETGRPLRGLHTEGCRQRMERILQHADDGRARIERAAEKFAKEAERMVEEEEADRASPDRWRAGWVAKLRNLVKRPELNGSDVVLVKLKSHRGRWEVKRTDGAVANVLYENLELLRPERNTVGTGEPPEPAGTSQDENRQQEPQPLQSESQKASTLLTRDPDREPEAKRQRVCPEDAVMQDMGGPASGSASSSAAMAPDDERRLWQEMLCELMHLSSGEEAVHEAGKAGISEVYSPPRIAPFGRRAGHGPGWSLDLSTNDPEGRPWNFDLAESRERARRLIEQTKPTLLIGSPMCTWFSTLVQLGRAQIGEEEYQRQRQRAVDHLAFAFELYALQAKHGRYFLHEHPLSANSWDEKCVIDFVLQHSGLSTTVTHMCQFGMVAQDRDGETGPVYKPTRWLSNCEGITKELEKFRCPGGHAHVALLDGRAAAAAVYPPKLCAAIVRGFSRQLRSDLQKMTAAAAIPMEELNRNLYRRGRDDEVLREALSMELLMEEELSLGSLAPSEEDEAEQNGEFEDYEAFDDINGGALDPEGVHRARMAELDYLWRMGVYTYASRKDAVSRQRKVIRLKWIDSNKGDASRPNLRSRLVAMEIRRKGVAAIFSATPPLESVRALISIAASEAPGDSDPLRLYLADVSRAHFYAPAVREV